MPASWADNEGRKFLIGAELVRLGASLERNVSTNSIVKVDLAFNHRLPSGGRGVLKIGHVGVDIGIKGINDHLSVGRTSNFDTSVFKTWSRLSSSPIGVITNIGGFGKEVGKSTGINFGLANNTLGKKLFTTAIESSVKSSNKSDSVLGKNVTRESGIGAWISTP